MEFDEIGTKRFAVLSTDLVKKHFAIVFEGRIQSAPIVNERITGGRAMITLGSGRLDGETSVKRTETVCSPPPQRKQSKLNG
ncbi:MAG: preprotein translocase subunit SecD [Myxococcota bacterium]